MRSKRAGQVVDGAAIDAMAVVQQTKADKKAQRAKKKKKARLAQLNLDTIFAPGSALSVSDQTAAVGYKLKESIAMWLSAGDGMSLPVVPQAEHRGRCAHGREDEEIEGRTRQGGDMHWEPRKCSGFSVCARAVGARARGASSASRLLIKSGVQRAVLPVCVAQWRRDGTRTNMSAMM
jgi:hypothetical protein